MSARLFISHANEDAAAADRIVGYLESHGVPCWISSRDIPPRAIYADAIASAMQACSACAVLVSQASNQSNAVKRELELASHNDKAFIPICLDGAEPAAGLDYYLRNTQWLDYRRDGDRALDRIVANVQGTPPPSTPAPTGRSSTVVAIGLAALVIGVGGWFAWARWASPGETETPIDDVSALVGSYHWDGVACGDGPTVTQENGSLVFTMPGTPTYRHTVLSAESQADDTAVQVTTRVTAPADSEGQEYKLVMRRGGKTLEVISEGRTDSWDRCP